MSDREAIVSLAALVEGALETAISWSFRGLKQGDYDAMFRGQEAPLQAFSSKTKVAFAVGAISLEIRDQLEIIRKLRNVFAHAVRPLDLTEPTLLKLAKKLSVQAMLPPSVEFKADDDGSRTAFNNVGLFIFRHLAEYIAYRQDGIKTGAIAPPQTFRGKYI